MDTENANNPSSIESNDTKNDENDDYELTEEQKEAVRQMQRMQYEKLEDDEWDPSSSIFGEMDYSTFVSQRLKEVNEQWDKEPLPENDNRQKLIEFKKDQELTSVYAPTPYPGEEGDEKVEESTNGNMAANDEPSTQEDHGEDKQSATVDGDDALPGTTLVNGTAEKNKQKKKSLKFVDDDDSNRIEDKDMNNLATAERDEPKPASTAETSSEDVSTSNNKTSKNDALAKDEKVLIELNGKFELVSVKDLQSMGYPLPAGVESSTKENNSGSTQEDSYSHHTRSSRPTSSAVPRSTSSANVGGRRRAQSATNTRSTVSRGLFWDISTYVSPYALSPEQKEIKEQREKIIKEREKTEKERKKEEEKRKQEEAESAFQWWLGKKEEERYRRQLGDKAQDEEARKQENEEAFNNWCAEKKEQQKKDRLLKNRERRERDDAYFLRSRDECEEAFKKWVRSKRKEQHIMNAWGTRKVKSKKKPSRTRSGRPNVKPEWNNLMH